VCPSQRRRSMDAKKRTIVMLILVLSLVTPACGISQLLGPTPTPTSTPTLTSTPTPTPLPVEPLLLAKGFVLVPDSNCSDGPCKFYKNTDLLMAVTYYENGTFIVSRILLTADINMQQGPIQVELFNTLFPKDIAEAALGNLDGGNLPYSGTVSGYEYGAYVDSTGIKDASGEDVLRMVTYLKPAGLVSPTLTPTPN
jgi:hypothetical protein